MLLEIAVEGQVVELAEAARPADGEIAADPRDLKLDVGYSYSRIAGGVVDYDSTTGARSVDKGFTDHVIHAGLRYQLW